MLDAHCSMNPVGRSTLWACEKLAARSPHSSPELSRNHLHQMPVFPEFTGIFGFRFQNFPPTSIREANVSCWAGDSRSAWELSCPSCMTQLIAPLHLTRFYSHLFT